MILGSLARDDILADSHTRAYGPIVARTDHNPADFTRAATIRRLLRAVRKTTEPAAERVVPITEVVIDRAISFVDALIINTPGT